MQHQKNNECTQLIALLTIYSVSEEYFFLKWRHLPFQFKLFKKTERSECMSKQYSIAQWL